MESSRGGREAEGRDEGRKSRQRETGKVKEGCRDMETGGRGEGEGGGARKGGVEQSLSQEKGEMHLALALE